MSGTTFVPSSDLSSFLGSDPDLDRLLDNVQIRLSGAPPSLIRMMAWNAIEEFAIRSTFFRRFDVPWTMAPGVDSYDFNPWDANNLVCWVIGVQGMWQYRIDAPATLRDLRPSPTLLRQGTAALVLKPVSLDASMPPELWTTWFEVMLDGTLFRLHGMPAKPWSSPQLAQYHGTRFRQGINRARDIANRFNSPQQSGWHFPYFATGRNNGGTWSA